MKIQKQKILIGWSQRDVTPSGRVSLRGQFHVRLTDQVKDSISCTALALEREDGTEQAIMVSLDAVSVSDYVTDGCRSVLSDKLSDFDCSKLVISATHTHTAPDQPGVVLSATPEIDGVMTGSEYGDLLVERISEAAIEAWQNRKIGAVSWAREYAAVGFNRRVSYFDGSTVMYGQSDSEEFSHIEGDEDHCVEMLFTYDLEHNLTGMIVNVACPSQCTEQGYFISADYWHETRQAIRKSVGENVHILAQCAAAGDQSPRTMINRPADQRMMRLKGFGDDYNMARRVDIAEKISLAINRVVPLVESEIHDQVEFAHLAENIDLPMRSVSAEDLAQAESEVQSWKAKLSQLEGSAPDDIEYSSAYRRIGFNQRVIDKYHAQQQGNELALPVELHAIRIGQIAISTNRFEYYLDFSKRIKARSKALQTFVTQLAGNGTYLPTKRSMSGGSYGAYIASTPIGYQGGQEIVAHQVKSINSMFDDE